ncbi:protein MOTHER of FT and TFL1 [Senna tora]|uniref:Protein MOTHER of FT and TFL1 n=1 Tax=Senna tora TaxID=362788 RepID=A0A834WYB2_9FABA|nr:protein MOTHER of FT and TFL1 [Senna tora]
MLAPSLAVFDGSPSFRVTSSKSPYGLGRWNDVSSLISTISMDTGLLPPSVAIRVISPAVVLVSCTTVPTVIEGAVRLKLRLKWSSVSVPHVSLLPVFSRSENHNCASPSSVEGNALHIASSGAPTYNIAALNEFIDFVIGSPQFVLQLVLLLQQREYQTGLSWFLSVLLVAIMANRAAVLLVSSSLDVPPLPRTANSGGKEILSYVGPRPPVGIHRYILVLFKQNQALGLVDQPTSRIGFNTRFFARQLELGLPIATVYFNSQKQPTNKRR